MTAPRPRAQAGPPSPPDRRPPRRGGGSSPYTYTYAASAAGRPAGPARLRRGLVNKIIRTLTCSILLPLLATFVAATAQASEERVLVNNTNSGGGSIIVGYSETISEIRRHIRAQAFNVKEYGDNSLSFTLTEVSAEFTSIRALERPRVSIYGDNSGVPGSSLIVLNVPSDLTDTNTHAKLAFTAPADSTLRVGSTYWVVFECLLGAQPGVGQEQGNYTVREGNDNESNSSEDGWTIDDSHYNKDGDTDWNSRGNPIGIEVKGIIPNFEATGAPTITGEPLVGETLTASRSGIEDLNGRPDEFDASNTPNYGYQWIRVDGGNEADISGATAKTYTPVAADVGKKIKVRVSYVDGDSYNDSATSASYPSSGTILSRAPTSADGTITTTEDAAHVFAASDFSFMDPDADATLGGVRIVSVPETNKGSLLFDGVAVAAGRQISKAELDAGKFKYAPPNNANGTNYTSFTFKVVDNTNAVSVTANTLTINVTPVQDAPQFSETSTTRTVPENSDVGTSVGAAVTARTCRCRCGPARARAWPRRRTSRRCRRRSC